MKIETSVYQNLRYIVSYPERYDGESKYPVIFYTHGAGSRGDDLAQLNIDAIIRHNPSVEDFIIVAPQCYADTWFEIFEQLIDFCEYVYHLPFTDPARFYSSGVSMGGYAAYQLMMSRPHLFAAGMICCGGGMYWNAARLKDIPLLAFHGLLDETVLHRESVIMTESVNRSGGHAKLVTFPECDHNCWDKAYGSEENFKWLLCHEKS